MLENGAPWLILGLPHELTNSIANRVCAQDDAIGGDTCSDMWAFNYMRQKWTAVRFVCPDVIELTQLRKIGNGAIAKTGDVNKRISGPRLEALHEWSQEDVLEIQYENSKPILLENGRALTRIAPSIAGMYISTPAYDLPMNCCEARVTPNQIVRTAPHRDVRKVSYNTKEMTHFQPHHRHIQGELSG